MLDRDASYLLDILDAARLVQEFVQGVDVAEFKRDVMRHSAVIRQLEVAGEATKQLSVATRARHPHIPWKTIAGMRDVLIHAYRGVDLEEVWRAATASVPALIAAFEPLVPPATQEEE